MTDRWNPNADDECVYGLEWNPTRQVDRPIGGTGPNSYSWKLTGSVTEDIDRLYLWSPQDVPGAYDTVDVYAEDDLVAVNETTDVYPYSGDANALMLRPLGGRWFSGDSRTESVNQDRMTTETDDWYNLIQPGTPTPGTFRGAFDYGLLFVGFVFDDPVPLYDYQFIGLTPVSVLYDAPLAAASPALPDYRSTFSRWAFHVDNLSSNVGTDRVLGLTVSCVCQRLVDPRARSSEYDQPYRVRPFLSMNGTIVLGQASTMPSNPQRVSFTWTRNPVTGGPWTTDDLDDFDVSTGVNAVGWFMSRPNDPQVRAETAGAIYEATAEVTHVPETRSAVAYRTTETQVFGWNEYQVEAIPGGGDWSKQDGTTYLMNARLDAQAPVDWRPTLSLAGLSVRALGAGPGDANSFAEVVPSFAGTIPRDLGEPTGYAPACLLRLPSGSGDVCSVDSQPYAVIQDEGRLGIIRPVSGQQFLWQLLPFDASVDPPTVLRFWARSENDQPPQAQIGAWIVDESNNLEANSAVLTPDQLVSPGVWQRFELPIEEVSWSSDATHTVLLFAFGDGVGWQVAAYQAGEAAGALFPTGADIPSVTYGGTTLAVAAGGDPFTVRSFADSSINLGKIPDTPEDLTAQYDPVTYGWDLTWSGAGEDPCSQPGYYEVQRRSTNTRASDYSSDWQTVFIAEVDGTAETYSVTDFEGFRGPNDGTADNCYRIRLVATTGFASEWSEEVCAETDDAELPCWYLLRSNHWPDNSLPLWFMVDQTPRRYRLLEQVTFVEFEGRDGAVAARGLTDRLDSFEIDAIVAVSGAKDAPPLSDYGGDVGRRLFDTLAVIGGNKRDDDGRLWRLPYVSVTDEDGNRWFAVLETPTAERLEPSHRHTQTVIVREVTRTATPVTVVDLGDGVLGPEPAPSNEPSPLPPYPGPGS